MTEREKIIKVIDEWANKAVKANKFDGASVYNPHNAAELADALIAAGIGDVTEWKEKAKKHRVQVLPDGTIKQLYSDEEVEDIARQRDEYKHRAEVAERALKRFAENVTCEDCPFFSDCASSEKMEDLIHSKYCFAEYLKQAEKELAEEGKEW